MRLASIRNWIPALFLTLLAACGGDESAQTEVVATGAGMKRVGWDYGLRDAGWRSASAERALSK